MNTVRVSRAAFSAADEIPLPQALNACAFVVKSETEGLWQKTLVVEFTERRRALSTNDGILDILSAVNHAAHQTIWNGTSGTVKKGHGDWMTVYMAKVREQTAQRLGVKTGEIALMGTAADLDNLAVATRLCAPFVVTALVTAGAKGNAIRTGVDAGNYIEPDPAVECISIGDAPVPGTVNIVLLTNARLSDGRHGTGDHHRHRGEDGRFRGSQGPEQLHKERPSHRYRDGQHDCGLRHLGADGHLSRRP